MTATANNSGFVPDFLFQGTRDETAFCCVPTALTLYRGLGVQRILEYNSKLVKDASALLVGMWDTEVLAPPSLQGAFMASIRLPLPFTVGSNDDVGRQGEKRGDTLDNNLNALLLTPLSHNVMRDLLLRHFSIEYVKLFNFGKSVWVRISCQIYNQIEDYQKLGVAVSTLVKNGTFCSELKRLAKNLEQQYTNLSQVSMGDGRWDH